MLEANEPIANLILFEVANENELISKSMWLKDVGIRHHMFYEPDYDTGYTAICCEPLAGEDRLMFSGGELFRWEREPEYMAGRRETVAA